MADLDDFDFEDDDTPALGEDGEGMPDIDPVNAEDENSIGITRQNIREWLNRRRGWVLMFGLAIAQAIFAIIIFSLQSDAKPVGMYRQAALQDLATDMLGYEVKIDQIYQLIPVRGGKKMTVGLDVSLILGQLPEERIEGAPRPTPEEMDLFIKAIQDMEPRIRSRVNTILQRIPAADYGTVDVHKKIKDEIKDYINNSLDGLDFGKRLRKDIGKHRVTEVLLPMFVRQTF